jgi:hypothetical protein
MAASAELGDALAAVWRPCRAVGREQPCAFGCHSPRSPFLSADSTPAFGSLGGRSASCAQRLHLSANSAAGQAAAAPAVSLHREALEAARRDCGDCRQAEAGHGSQEALSGGQVRRALEAAGVEFQEEIRRRADLASASRSGANARRPQFEAYNSSKRHTHGDAYG